jgi:hypothetical protein
MNKTFGSLVAATAAAAALSLVTLASASAASTSASTGSSAVAAGSSAVAAGSSAVAAGSQVRNPNWAGWVDTINHPGGYNRFNRVTAMFKVPGINCAKSVIGGKRYPNGPYSAAAFWVGFDGTNSDSAYLEQAGIGATCSGPKAYAQYNAWYQMTPTKHVIVPLKGSRSNPGTVRAGDSIQVQVLDTAGVDPNSPKWANPKYAGYSYSVLIRDTTRNVWFYQNGLKPSDSTGYAGGQAPDSSAEVITEGPGIGGPYHKPYATGLADMGTVNYTDVYVSSLASGWIYELNMHSTNGIWTAAPWIAGHNVWWGWQTLMHPGSLGGSVGNYSSPFSTYWK